MESEYSHKPFTHPVIYVQQLKQNTRSCALSLGSYLTKVVSPRRHRAVQEWLHPKKLNAYSSKLPSIVFFKELVFAKYLFIYLL